MAALDDLLGALSEPLSGADTKGGWTHEKRTHWMTYFEGMKHGLEAESAERHLFRWLDHDGITSGPLLDEAVNVQRLLRERFAK